jgi:hypothetical protein
VIQELQQEAAYGPFGLSLHRKKQTTLYTHIFIVPYLPGIFQSLKRLSYDLNKQEFGVRFQARENKADFAAP